MKWQRQEHPCEGPREASGGPREESGGRSVRRSARWSGPLARRLRSRSAWSARLAGRRRESPPRRYRSSSETREGPDSRQGAVGGPSKSYDRRRARLDRTPAMGEKHRARWPTPRATVRASEPKVQLRTEDRCAVGLKSSSQAQPRPTSHSRRCSSPVLVEASALETTTSPGIFLTLWLRQRRVSSRT